MINNKVIEYELKDTEKQIEDLLLRIKQLRKEVSDMLPKEVKKVVHKRFVLDRNETGTFINLNDYFLLTADVSIVNYVRYSNHETTFKYYFDNSSRILLTHWTAKKEIILTHIPSKNLVIIVER